MERTYEALLEENNELRKALGSTKEIVERFRSDNESLRRMHEEFKLHHERLKKECQEAQSKSIDAIKSRKGDRKLLRGLCAEVKILGGPGEKGLRRDAKQDDPSN